MAADAGVYAYSAVLMGSPVLLKLFQHDEHLAADVFRLIKQQEDRLTVNRVHSDVMAINHAAGQQPVHVSPAVFSLIQRAWQVSTLPGSCFNFTIGPLVKRWKIGFRGSTVPPAAEIQALLALTDPHQVVLDEALQTVYLAKAGMEIDLGAIAKGYIADLVRKYLMQQQVNSALINLGGNVQTLGSGENGEGWTVGLKTPFAEADALVGVLHVHNKSVVTSGIYERYFELDGQRYHHILDPKTGYPLDNELASVTIVSEYSLDGDIWTTLIYGLGVEKGLAYLADVPQIEAVFVTKDGRVILSSQRQFTFTLLDSHYRLVV